MKHQRIHIIGPPGSGKTDLAVRLADLFGYPVFNLDLVAYSDADSGAFQAPRPRLARLVAVDEYAELPFWIAEGVYFSWAGKSFKNADVIVLLHPPCHIRARNLQQRHASLITKKPDHRLTYLLEQNDSFDSLYNERIAGFLRPFQAKMRAFTGPSKAYKFFARLSQQ